MNFIEIAYSASAGAIEAGNFVERLNDVILFPLIALLSGIAILFFIYGSLAYAFGGASDTVRETGKKHMTYGIIGLVIMVSAWGILMLAANSFGVGDELNCANNPDGNCDIVNTTNTAN